jgi:TIR domain
MADIFLSYRRDDSRSATGRLADRLEALFGPERVFRDVDSIAPGLDFEAALTRAVGGASVMLAVIGPRWADIRDAQGHLRLDDPQDTVRREIEAALATGLPVIPVLVEGASMPTAATMPASLAPFARCQAFDLDDAGWQDDVARLAVQLQQRHGVDPSAPAGPAQRAGSGALELVELLAQPRRVILRRAGPGGRDALQRATLLLLASLLLGNLLIGLPLELGFGLVGWVLNGTLLGLLAAAGGGALITAGWRVAGVRSGWQRSVIGAACLWAGGWLYLAAGLMVFALAWAIGEPGVFTALLSRWRTNHQGAPGEWAALADAGVGATALAGVVLASAFWLAGLAWTLAAWNALRIAFGAGPLRAAVAGAVSLATFAGLLWAVLWAAGD